MKGQQTMRLGVCYYPEHWPEPMWADDAAGMVAMGISLVRIGEFAWSRIEPEPGRFDWGWLDRAVETLHRAGLGIIMGTPTATPPKWLVDRMPDMIAYDRDGRPRRFGSRRHYCFSHAGYAQEARRITQAMAERYGRHPAVVMWQTDNEYGCHDTAVSYSDAARDAFRDWLARRYGHVDALNHAWGNVFWSMDYPDFASIELPHLTVTEANPAHWLDFRRFSSDQVVAFNRAQADILRAASPGRPVAHNFMGFFTQFDHHAVGADCDIAAWDSYPLGFLESFWFSDADKATYRQQGHPDIAAFHHDLYRGCSRGRWAVMEQQPGPVNWAAYNPAPLEHMVRLWTLEAMAHGAEFVSYFRWRQAPFAQEQMHAGLLRPDSVHAPAAAEVRHAARDIAHIGPVPAAQADVAMLFSYTSDWVTDIQPQGRGFKALRQAFEAYTALRELGLSIDIIAPDAAIDGYRMIVMPCEPVIDELTVERLRHFDGPVVIGPRSGSKTAHFAMPAELAPGPLQQLLPIKVTRVESLRPDIGLPVEDFTALRWVEDVATELLPNWRLPDGRGLLFNRANIQYLAAWLDAAGLRRVMAQAAGSAGLVPRHLPEGLRLRQAGDLQFAFNYGLATCTLCDVFADAEEHDYLVGGPDLPPSGVAVWRARAKTPG